MKKLYFFIVSTFFLIITSGFVSAQSFDGIWETDYVTADDPSSNLNDNYTGYNTLAVAVVGEDAFVAVVNRSSRNAHYLVGYRNASHLDGRLGIYGYGGDNADFQMLWVINFDQESLFDVNDLVVNGDIIYVANNDTVNHSILAFELKEDSIYSYPQRFITGTDYLRAIDMDESGRIFVLKGGDTTTAASVLILDDPNQSPAWSTSGKNGTILKEFSLDNIGDVRGLAVNSDGTIIYVSYWEENKIDCYIGDPVSGYTLNNDFNFEVSNTYQSTNSFLSVGPHGLNFMPDKNILFVTHDTDLVTGDGYEYGRIYLVNPNSGEVIDTINVAEWNASTHIDGKYNDPDSLGRSSGYASVVSVDFDENYNAYSQSYYGWAIDKWLYSDILPTIDITIVSVEKIDSKIPDNFTLKQNYPNPFNPTTTIEFSVNDNKNISLQIYSVTGELVSNLISNEFYSKGNYKITLDGSKLSSGTYFYKLSNGVNTLTKKMILIK